MLLIEKLYLLDSPTASKRDRADETITEIKDKRTGKLKHKVFTQLTKSVSAVQMSFDIDLHMDIEEADTKDNLCFRDFTEVATSLLIRAYGGRVN